MNILANSNEILELCRTRQDRTTKNIEQITYDEITKLEKESNIDAIIHCASLTSVNCNDPKKDYARKFRA